MSHSSDSFKLISVTVDCVFLRASEASEPLNPLSICFLQYLIKLDLKTLPLTYLRFLNQSISNDFPLNKKKQK